MHRLGHGAELAFGSAGETERETHAGAHLLGIKSQQAPARGARADGSQGRSCMPAALVVLVVNGLPHASHRLETDDVSIQETRPVAPPRFSHRQDRRHQHRTGMRGGGFVEA